VAGIEQTEAQAKVVSLVATCHQGTETK
jgi:hypothetical protein